MRNLFIGILVCLVAAPAALSTDTVVEEIIARINNQIITRTELQRSEEQAKQEAQQQSATDPAKPVVDHSKDVLRDLIDQQLLLERGKDLGITADTEVIKKLDDMRKEMKLDSMEDLEKVAKDQGVSFEDFKQNMRNQIITQQVIGKEIGSRITVTKDEEQQFYDQHKSEMERPEAIKLSEIMIIPAKKDGSAPDDSDALAAAKTKAEDVLAQIRKGASFEDVAKKESQGATAAQGGDLGYFERGTLSKEIEDTTFAMKGGDVSDVIRTKQGFIILKVTEHQTAGVPSVKDIEPRLQDAVYMTKLQPALRDYLTKLRENAFIKIMPGYVDTGASPNQTAFVETETKEASAKQLKKKKKMLLF